MTTKEIGRVGYEAYAATTDGKTFDNREMPTWDALPQRIQAAWNAAGETIRAQFCAPAAEVAEPILRSTFRHDGSRDHVVVSLQGAPAALELDKEYEVTIGEASAEPREHLRSAGAGGGGHIGTVASDDAVPSSWPTAPGGAPDK